MGQYACRQAGDAKFTLRRLLTIGDGGFGVIAVPKQRPDMYGREVKTGVMVSPTTSMVANWPWAVALPDRSVRDGLPAASMMVTVAAFGDPMA
jgi:hypothetical protein